MAEPYFGRSYELTIGNKKFDATDPKKLALDIRFDVGFSIGAAKGGREGTVAILGLSMDTIWTFLQLAALDKEKAMDQMLGVTLKAGYFDVGLEDIIDGVVTSAKVTTPPEMWLILQVQEAPNNGGEELEFNIPYTSAGVQKKVAAKQCFAKFDRGFIDLSDNIEVVNEIPSRTLSLSGWQKVMEELSVNWHMVQRGRNIYAYPLETAESVEKLGVINANKEKGLLGVDGITAYEAQVTTWLQPEHINLCNLVLKSDLNKQANGKYLIVSKHFIGHFRGKEWYTKYYCKGKNI